MNYPPIAIFTFNRPNHLRITLENLSLNNESKQSALYVFIDGPRNQNDIQKQVEIKSVVSEFAHNFHNVELNQSHENRGLSKSIISGINLVLENHDEIIVLEDDLRVSNSFLKFMHHNLEVYKLDDQVASIHGYIYPLQKDPPSVFFLKGSDCWGWATWKRAWATFEKDGQKLLNELENRNLVSEFDYGNTAPFTQMLKEQISGKNNSWAIRWYASCFLKNMYTLYPTKTLVQNIGLDGSGTHCDTTNDYFSHFDNSLRLNERIEIKEDTVMRKEFGVFFQRINNPGIPTKILKRLKNLLSTKGLRI